MTIHGVIHGKMIELECEPGWPDGETIAVTIEHAAAEATAQWGRIPSVELWADRLIFDSTVLSGERIVKGTRLAAEALVGELQQGQSDKEMLQAHPELTHEDLVALHHYARTPLGLRQSFGAWAEEADELDEFLAVNRQRRKLHRREIEP
jgi:uncharacterized protein (DUF433 family)